MVTNVGSPVLLHSHHMIILQHPVTKPWNIGKDFDYPGGIFGVVADGLWDHIEEKNFEEI